jgi:hypothetical protein
MMPQHAQLFPNHLILSEMATADSQGLRDYRAILEGIAPLRGTYDTAASAPVFLTDDTHSNHSQFSLSDPDF